MSLAPLDELHFLTEALKAHAAWTKSTGGYGLPACDEKWLQARREHYRQTQYLGETETARAPLEASSSPITPPAVREPAAAGASQQVAATGRGGTALAAPMASTPALKVAEPAAPLTNAIRQMGPSTVGFEVSALVNSAAVNSAAVNSAADNDLARPAEVERRPAPEHPRSAAPTSLEKAPEPVAGLSAEERRNRLTLLENQVRQCRDCGLCEDRTNTVFARGNGSVGVAFVGEGPGADEDAQGYPFVGAAGQLLDKMIAAMGLERESVYVCNIVKCRPPKNRKPTEEEMATCRHYVVSQLDLIQPRVIVALGATAVEGLLGLKLGITRLRGTWRLYKGSIPVMPTFHPAYLLRQPDAKREVWEDLQAVLTRINMPLPQRRN